MIAGGPQTTIDFIPRFYLYLTMRDGCFLWHATSSSCLSLSFVFDAILYSKSTNEDSDAGHVKCSRGPQVPHSWSMSSCNFRYRNAKTSFCNRLSV